MKRIIFLLVLSCFLLGCEKEKSTETESTSQKSFSFQKAIGGEQNDYANSLIEVDGNLYLFGTTKSFNDSNGDFYLVKTNSRGSIIFERTYGSSSAEEGSKIILTSDGNLLLIGWTQNTSSGTKNIYLIKTDQQGSILWEKTYGGNMDDFANDIIELTNNQFLITGATTSYGKGSSDIYLLWVDQMGNLIQEIFHGATDQDGGTQSIELNNGDIVCYGYTRNYGATSRDYYLLKMNSNGDSLWSKRYGGDDYEETQAFTITSSGEFVLNGHSASTDPIHDMLGIKVDSLGNVIWEKNFGGTAHDGGMAFLINSRNEYVFVARSMSFEANQNIFITVTDPQGNILNDEFIGQNQADMANDIIEYNGHYYLVGQTTSFGDGDLDVYLVRKPI